MLPLELQAVPKAIAGLRQKKNWPLPTEALSEIPCHLRRREALSLSFGSAAEAWQGNPLHVLRHGSTTQP